MRISSTTYKHPCPDLTVDCVVWGTTMKISKSSSFSATLSHSLGRAPPSGFVHLAESLPQAARRELQAELGLDRGFLKQLFSFGDIERGLRGRVVSVAYYARVRLMDHRVHAATDPRDARWFPVWRASCHRSDSFHRSDDEKAIASGGACHKSWD